MPHISSTEKDLEVRSLRLILSGVLRMIGELSEFLTFDAEMLPMVLKKLEAMAMELKEAEDAARKEREQLLEEVSKWLPIETAEKKDDDDDEDCCDKTKKDCECDTTEEK